MKDLLFKKALFTASLFLLLIGAGMVYTLFDGALPAFDTFGFFKFIGSTAWDPHPDREAYGALPFIVGTLFTAFLALLIAIPFALPVALFTGVYYRGTKAAHIIGAIVDLLAGIPSIVYGLWGFYTLRPWIIESGFSTGGFGIFTSAVVLAIMIIPYASSLSAEFLSMVPNDLKEGAYSLGATRLDMIQQVVFPFAGSGIFASFILALGRALGETMAVTMLIGNTNNLPLSLTATGNTMASVIANQFGEADGLKLSALIAIGFLLFILTALINLAGKFIIKRFNQ